MVLLYIDSVYCKTPTAYVYLIYMNRCVQIGNTKHRVKLT